MVPKLMSTGRKSQLSSLWRPQEKLQLSNLKLKRNSTNMMMKTKSFTTMKMLMQTQKEKKIMLKRISFKRIREPGAKVTTRAQIYSAKLPSTTKRKSSCSTRRGKKLNKRNSNTKKSRPRDVEKKRPTRGSKPTSKQPKQEKRESEEKLRRKQLQRRESKRPENVRRRKRPPRKPDEPKHRRKQPRLPASRLSKPFQTLSPTILT